MIRFACLNCGKRLKIAADQAGKHVKCSHCGMSVPVPQQSTLPEESPAAATARHAGWLSRKSQWILGLSIGGALVLASVLVLVVLLNQPSELDQNLKDLKGNDGGRARQALQWLVDTEPNDAQRPPVTAALEPIIFEGDIHRNLDPDLVLRVYLMWAGKDNVPALIRMVQTPTLPAWNTRKTGQVMDTLGKLHDPRAAPVLASKLPDPELHQQATSDLRLLGPSAESAVLDVYFSGDAPARARAAQLLTDYGTKSKTIAAEARNRLKSNQPEIRRIGLLWFDENAPTDDTSKVEIARLLAKLLDDPSPEVARHALLALRLWATKDVVPQLVEYARREQKNPEGNPLLIDLLAQFPSESAAEAVAMQLPNPHTRARASAALLKMGSPATKTVLHYINVPDPAVNKEARGLARLLKISPAQELDQTLADIADSHTGRIRTALEHLLKLRPDDSNRLKISRALNAPLLDPNQAVADEALNAVEIYGTKENTETLTMLLGNFDKAAMQRNLRVIDMLAGIQDPRSLPALADGLNYFPMRGPVSKALLSFGPAAEIAVVPFLKSNDKGVCFEACRILAEIGTAKSLEALRATVKMYANVDNILALEARRAQEAIENRKQ